MKTKIASVFFALIMLITFSCQQQQDKNGIAGSLKSDNKPVNQQQKHSDENLLKGKWSIKDSPFYI